MSDLEPADLEMSDLETSGAGPERPPMLATTRFCFPLILLLTFVVASSLPGAAQFQGVPPGQFQGVPATPFQGVPSASFGVHPNAGMSLPGCCAQFFLPNGFSPLVPVPSLAQGRHHHRHHNDKDRNESVGSVAVPVYIPYAVPNGADPDDDTADNQDSIETDSQGSRTANREGAARRRSNRYSGQETGQYPDRNFVVAPGNGADDESGYDPDLALADAAPEKVEEPVVAQPTTVLVFKDGHLSEVVNYAIVGDTLFDFAEDRARKIPLADLDLATTRKANDEHGVEFKVPPGSK